MNYKRNRNDYFDESRFECRKRILRSGRLTIYYITIHTTAKNVNDYILIK